MGVGVGVGCGWLKRVKKKKKKKEVSGESIVLWCISIGSCSVRDKGVNSVRRLVYLCVCMCTPTCV